MNSKAAFAAGAIAALVLGSGTAVAATGGNFILGKSNTAGTVTTLTNKNGPALMLRSRVGTPPLRVNNGVKVPRLNADKIDGKNASAFAVAGARSGVVTGAGEWVDIDEDGLDDMIVAFATCPRGAQLMGGGIDDFTINSILVSNRPLGGNSATWVGAVVADSGEQASDLEAYAVCLNLSGGASGQQLARQDSSNTDTASDAREEFRKLLATHTSDR